MDRTRQPLAFLTLFAYGFALFACGFALFAPTAVRADAQASVRGGFGLGKRFARVGDELVFDFSTRGDVMFGAPKPRSFRVGPAFELRTADFYTLEGAAGAGILIPMPGDFPIGLTGLVGYAGRLEAPDAPVGIGTFTWGYRGYNYHSWYGFAINLFVSARKDLTGSPLSEISAGLEVDLMFNTIVPLLAAMNLMDSSDPDEPPKKRR